MKIQGFLKTTLLDYPKHMAATIFVSGCNMRCPFCHNGSLIQGASHIPIIPTETVLSYLTKRRTVLEGVCITGGEPTLYPTLPDFIRSIKALGLKVKLDTNGSNPALMKYLVENQLIDYIAMDIKNTKEKYNLSTGVSTVSLLNIQESITYLLTNPIDYEFRTTVVKELHHISDLIEIGTWIKGARAYYLQPYRHSEDVLIHGLHSHSKDTLLECMEHLTPLVHHVEIRGLD